MKSHVSMEQQVCIVCGIPFDTGSILLDKRLKNSMEKHTVTGWGLCPEHENLFDDGYVALVGVSNKHGTEINLKQDTAERTGEIIHVSRTALNRMLGEELPSKLPMVWADEELMEVFKRNANHANT